jgi:predicted ester cyclase
VSTETNKAVVRRYLEAWATSDAGRRTALFDAVLAPEFWDRVPVGERTRDELLREAAAYHAAGTDIGFDVEQLVAEGEWVACRATCHFTDPATGRRVAVGNPFFARVVDGQMVEGYGYFDRFGVLEQTGQLPSPGD